MRSRRLLYVGGRPLNLVVRQRGELTTMRPVSHLSIFLLAWVAVTAGMGAVSAQMRAPYAKLRPIRVAGILSATSLIVGVWYFSGNTQGLYFAVGGIVAVTAINFFCIRVCPHCARASWPRLELWVSFGPRCGTDMSRPHERTATWRRAASPSLERERQVPAARVQRHYRTRAAYLAAVGGRST